MRKNLIAITLLFAIGFVALPSASADTCDIPAFVKDFVKKLKDECKKLEGAQASTSRSFNFNLTQNYHTSPGRS